MAEYMAWKRSADRCFGEPVAAYDKLQRPWPAEAGFELIETSYFGFNIPEAQLNGEVYFWFHPNLGVASGGLVIFQGMKGGSMRPDYAEWRNYMPIPDDMTNCTYPNGVTMRQTRPEEFDISYSDAATDTHLQLNTRAIMPAAFRPAGGHITQAMRNKGTLTLRGKRYEIDGYFTRDRSWGDPRSERQIDFGTAPFGWHVGVFDDKLAFHVSAYESPELNPALKDCTHLADGKNFIWGYLWIEGQLLGIKSCRKRATRDVDGACPLRVELQMVDEHDNTHVISGDIQARTAYGAFPNSTVIWNQTRWRMGDCIGYGDTQEIFYLNFLPQAFI